MPTPTVENAPGIRLTSLASRNVTTLLTWLCYSRRLLGKNVLRRGRHVELLLVIPVVVMVEFPVVPIGLPLLVDRGLLVIGNVSSLR